MPRESYGRMTGLAVKTNRKKICPDSYMLCGDVLGVKSVPFAASSSSSSSKSPLMSTQALFAMAPAPNWVGCHGCGCQGLEEVD